MREVTHILTIGHFLRGVKLLFRAHPTYFVCLFALCLVGTLAMWIPFYFVLGVLVAVIWPIKLVGSHLRQLFNSQDLCKQLELARKSARISQALLGLLIVTMLWLIGPGDQLSETIILVSVGAIVIMAGAFSLTVAIHGWLAEQFQNSGRGIEE